MLLSCSALSSAAVNNGQDETQRLGPVLSAARRGSEAPIVTVFRLTTNLSYHPLIGLTQVSTNICQVFNKSVVFTSHINSLPDIVRRLTLISPNAIANPRHNKNNFFYNV